MDSQKQIDMIFLEHLIWYQRLLTKLQYYGINNKIYHWISNRLTKRTQRVLVFGSSSNYVLVTSGVLQDTVLGPLMFLLCINDINKNITSSKLGLFANDCVIYKTIYNKDDSIALQNDLSALSDWARI